MPEKRAMNDLSETEMASIVRKALSKIRALESELDDLKHAAHEPIAVIGMSCRFPGAKSPQEFWELIQQGVDAVGEIPQDRFDVDSYFDPRPATPGRMYTRRAGLIEDIDQFDPEFFRISVREAEKLDPQQRLLLELSWEALERAGQTGSGLATRTGVFVGINECDYRDLIISHGAEMEAYSGSGNTHSTASGRLSYHLGFTGPNLAIDTACSSSLVAVALGVASLRKRDCDMALVGGVQALLTPEGFVRACQLRMLAPDGCCKSFDERADGYVRAEGGGVVILKRLSEALASRDNILAVIRGAAVNHDGYTSALTVPSGPSQVAVIERALADGGVRSEDISYVEAHGTGTALGDPIEIGALQQVFGAQAEPLMIGSVKTNIGHAEAAAGIAGFIKVVLALEHGEIPGSLHFDEPSSYIDWQRVPIRIPTKPTNWPGDSRLAGVSSFGFSGTNAHIVLENGPKWDDASALRSEKAQILSLSAKSPEALGEMIRKYQEFLESDCGSQLEDICFSANIGRRHFPCRSAFVGESREELLVQLSAKLDRPASHAKDPGGLAFLFTGQGNSNQRTGRVLFETQPVFKAAIERCEAWIESECELERSLTSVVFGEENDEGLFDPAYAQAALFALEYALAELWSSWGIQPDYVMGHSLGEYAAACVAGVFSLEDALRLVSSRGRLMKGLASGGSMLACLTSEARVRSAIEPFVKKVSVAAINGERNVVISGERSLLLLIARELNEAGVRTQELAVSHAFHSIHVEPMLNAFREVVSEIRFQTPRVPLVSSLSGRVAGVEITSTEYWVQQVRNTVRFASGVQTLCEKGARTFLEIGPSATLVAMARQVFDERGGSAGDQSACFLSSLRGSRSAWPQMLGSLADLYARGIEVDWRGFHESQGGRLIVLPTYPFQRRRCWLSGARSADSVPASRLPTLRVGSADKLSSAKNSIQESGDLNGEIMQSIESGEVATLVSLLEKSQDLSASEKVALPGVMKALVAASRVKPDSDSMPVGFVERLSQTPRNERMSHVLAVVRTELQPIFGSVPGDDIPFSECGIDSLMAVELRNRLRETTGLELPLGVVFEQPTITRMASFILEFSAVTESKEYGVVENPSKGLEGAATLQLATLAGHGLTETPIAHPLQISPWSVRAAEMSDLSALARLEREAYGWIGEDAIAPPELIADRIQLLNGDAVPWFWVLEREGEVVAWQVLQPTSVDPYTYETWAEVTDQGNLRNTFDPKGRNLYIVAGGASSRIPSVASHLLTLKTILMMQATERKVAFVCLAMPGFAQFHERTGQSPEDYIAITDEDGIPQDEFIGLSVYDWPVKPSFRVLRDGYPPDRDSGGHGVSTVFRFEKFETSVEDTCRRILGYTDLLGMRKAGK